jgi:hypothetical protein
VPSSKKEEGECTGTQACTASFSFLGFKVETEGIVEWWKKVKEGWHLIKETFAGSLEEAYGKNTTVCKVAGYAAAVGTYFIPESSFSRALGLTLGIGTTYAC